VNRRMLMAAVPLLAALAAPALADAATLVGPATDQGNLYLIADDDDTATYVARLEAAADEVDEEDAGDADHHDLIEEVERYLRDQ